LRSILRIFTNAGTNKGFIDLGSAPVDIRYVDGIWQRKDEEQEFKRIWAKRARFTGGKRDEVIEMNT
jgi:hypothetical protein